ncbi:hypothetical protein GCM10027425_11500 [Alteromonas gracilis]
MAVEAALVMPLLALLVFGMVDLAFLLRDYSAITSSTRAGTRIAATMAGAGPGTCETGPTAPVCTPTSSPKAAQGAADAVQRSITGMAGASVQRLLVFKANSEGYPGPESNRTMPENCTGFANCVTFVWRPAAEAFRYQAGSWDSRTINGCLNEQDSIGLHLVVRHEFVVGFLWDTVTVQDRAVTRFEPLSQDTCKAGRIAAHP